MNASHLPADRLAPDSPIPPALMLVEGLRDALMLLDDDWGITYLNARARRGFMNVGLDPAALFGKSIWEVLSVLDLADAAEPFARARAGGGPVHFDLHDPARHRWFEIDAMQVDAVLAVYWRDVTESRTSEAARAASEAEVRAAHRRLEELVASAPLAFMAMDDALNVLMWNAAAERMFQWTADEVVGRPLPTVPPEERESLLAMRERERRGESIHSASARRVRKDGVVIDVQVSTAPLRDRHGSVIGVIGMLADVSEQRGLEAQLRMAQKMEAVGLLAGGVAHDFNNLLTAIRGFASLLQGVIPAGGEPAEFVDEICKASDRAASLTAQLLAFSRQQLLRPESIELNAHVRGLERMLGLLVAEGGALELDLADDLGLVLADPGQLEQIILNLAVNARDAIANRPNGRITITTSNATLRDEFHRWRVLPAPGDYVRLDVRDNGIGMDVATKARIFDPFFTTKAVGHGTGLGLATVYGIAKQSRGYIWVESAPGEGSTFSVYLPRTTGDLVAHARPVEAAAQSAGGDVVLIVEDEDGVRKLVRRTLERHGYRVLEAANGTEALSLAGKQQVALMVTDVMMPGLLGPELVEAMHQILPGLPVLYMSGHAEEVARKGLLDPSIPFLPKPFSPAELTARVREVLNSSRV